MKKPWVVALTGASGSVYGLRLIRLLLELDHTVHLVISDAGWRVLHDECGWNSAKRQEAIQEAFGDRIGQVVYHPFHDIGASIASGSFRAAGMVVAPCSMGTLSGIARGASDNLIERAADVMLKEGRPLILVPRESPLHAIHLENMLTLARLNVRIVPAMPAFYHEPRSIEDLVDFMAGRILDSMGIEHDFITRWGGRP